MVQFHVGIELFLNLILLNVQLERFKQVQCRCEAVHHHEEQVNL